jgi:hypothetical protein
MRTSSNPAKWNRQMSLDDLVRLHWRSGHDATEKWNASNGVDFLLQTHEACATTGEMEHALSRKRLKMISSSAGGGPAEFSAQVAIRGGRITAINAAPNRCQHLALHGR